MCSTVDTGGSTPRLKEIITKNQETYIPGDLHLQEAAAGCIEIYCLIELEMSKTSERCAHLKILERDLRNEAWVSEVE